MEDVYSDNQRTVKYQVDQNPLKPVGLINNNNNNNNNNDDDNDNDDNGLFNRFHEVALPLLKISTEKKDK